MRIYVASRFKNYRESRRLMDELTGMGHTITCDWTRTDEFDEHGELLLTETQFEVTPVQQFVYAHQDMRGVFECDTLVLLADDDMCGAYMEVGMAIILSKTVCVIEMKRWTIFYSLPNVRLFGSREEFISYAEDLPHG